MGSSIPLLGQLALPFLAAMASPLQVTLRSSTTSRSCSTLCPCPSTSTASIVRLARPPNRPLRAVSVWAVAWRRARLDASALWQAPRDHHGRCRVCRTLNDKVLCQHAHSHLPDLHRPVHRAHLSASVLGLVGSLVLKTFFIVLCTSTRPG